MMGTRHDHRILHPVRQVRSEDEGRRRERMIHLEARDKQAWAKLELISTLASKTSKRTKRVHHRILSNNAQEPTVHPPRRQILPDKTSLSLRAPLNNRVGPPHLPPVALPHAKGRHQLLGWHRLALDPTRHRRPMQQCSANVLARLRTLRWRTVSLLTKAST